MGTTKQAEEIDLLELALFLVRRWYILLIAMLIGGGIAMTFYQIRVIPTYKASSEIYINNTDTIVNIQDVQLSSELTVDYERILMSHTLLQKVINKLDLQMSYQDLKKMIGISNPSDSHCLIITVTADTPDQAILITNTIVSYGIDQIYRIVGKDEPAVIDPALTDLVEVVKPSRLKYGIMGCFCAFILLAGLFTVQFLMDSTIKTDEDVEKYMKLTVLSVVPENSSYSTNIRKKKVKDKRKCRK